MFNKKEIEQRQPTRVWRGNTHKIQQPLATDRN